MAEETPLTGFVSAEGLTANPDVLHFNATSLHAFGLRYFKAYEATRDPQRIFTTAPETDDDGTIDFGGSNKDDSAWS
jgi:hypothetical protein